jgi:hypothetical protein
MAAVSVYRELNAPSPSLIAWLEARDQLYYVVDPRGVEHMFVDNDLPRDQDISEELVLHTGFALFGDDGEYIGSYRSLDRAIKAAAGAKTVVTADVEGVEPDEIITAGDE